MELPTGGFADRFGKRISLIFGALFFTLGLFWYAVSSQYWQFVIGELTIALGMAFISGADRAFIHQTLKSLNKEKDFNQTEGRVRGLNQVFQALGNIGGGFIGAVSLSFTLFATGISTLISFLIGLTFTKTRIELPREEKTNYLQTIKDSIQIVKSNSNVLWLTMFFAIINSLAFANYWFSQPYFSMLNIPIAYYGIIFAVFSLVSAFLSTLTDKLDTLLKDNIFMAIGLISIVSTFILGTFPSIYITPLFAVSSTIVVINQILIGAKTLAIVPGGRASTILSFQGLLKRSVYALIIPFLGIISDRFGISTALQFNSLLLAVLLIILFSYKQTMAKKLLKIKRKEINKLLLTIDQ